MLADPKGPRRHDWRVRRRSTRSPAGPALRTNQTLRFSEHALHHRRGEFASVRVLPARVIAADKRRQSVAELHDLAVPELRPRRPNHAATLQQLQPRIEADLAERDDDAHARQVSELDVEVIETARDLFGKRFVVGWSTPDSREDVGIGEAQAIIGALRCGDVRESGAIQRGHEEIA